MSQCNWEIEDSKHPISISPNNVVKQTTRAPVRISYLTEQTSHHPAVSAFYVDCPQRGITARGFDQISAKFTGTSIRLGPGQHNLGIFVTIEERDNEEYQLT